MMWISLQPRGKEGSTSRLGRIGCSNCEIPMKNSNPADSGWHSILEEYRLGPACFLIAIRPTV